MTGKTEPGKSIVRFFGIVNTGRKNLTNKITCDIIVSSIGSGIFIGANSPKVSSESLTAFLLIAEMGLSIGG